MIIGERLKEIRKLKGLSQGDIEKRTNLLRCYLSRCENGHTIPSVDTLEKWARAMEVPLYQIFFDSEGGEPRELKLPKGTMTKLSGKDAAVISRLTALVRQMKERDKKLLVGLAKKMSALDKS